MVSVAGTAASAVVTAHPENVESEERKRQEDLVGMRGHEAMKGSDAIYLYSMAVGQVLGCTVIGHGTSIQQ